MTGNVSYLTFCIIMGKSFFIYLAYGIVSFVITFLILIQGFSIIEVVEWRACVVISLVMGSLCECIRAVVSGKRFEPMRIWPWIIGGVASYLLYILI